MKNFNFKSCLLLACIPIAIWVILSYVGMLFSSVATQSLGLFSDVFGSSNSSISNTFGFDNYKEALIAEDFEAAHKILAQAEADFERMSEYEFEKKYGIKHWEYSISEAKEEVFDKEVQYLAAQGTDEANKRLLVLLNTQPMEGTPRSEGQELSKGEGEDYAKIDRVYLYDKGYSDYINWCGKYNAKCFQVLDIAISLDNKELAKMMVKVIKNDPGIISKRARLGKYDIYAHYTSKSKNEAILKYKEHFGELGNTDK